MGVLHSKSQHYVYGKLRRSDAPYVTVATLKMSRRAVITAGIVTLAVIAATRYGVSAANFSSPSPPENANLSSHAGVDTLGVVPEIQVDTSVANRKETPADNVKVESSTENGVTSTSVTVNGQSVEIPANGTATTTLPAEDGETNVTVVSQQSASGDEDTSRSSSSLRLSTTTHTSDGSSHTSTTSNARSSSSTFLYNNSN